MTDTDDDLQQLYGQALRHDERRPDARVRQAVLSHAQMMLDGAAGAQVKTVVSKTVRAANLPGWKAALVASLLLTPLVGILVTQHQEQLQEEQSLPASAPSSANLPAPAQARSQPSAPPIASGTGLVGGAVAALSTQAADDTAPQRADKTTPTAASRATTRPTLSDNETAKAATLERAHDSQSNSVQTTPPTATGATTALANAPAARLAGAAPPLARMESQSQQGATQEATKLAAPEPRAGQVVEGNALFFQLVRTGKVADVESLLAHGTPVNIRDSAGKTALIWAAQLGNEGLVWRLLALGADRDLVDGKGLTALYYAQQKGHSRIVQLLESPP